MRVADQEHGACTGRDVAHGLRGVVAGAIGRAGVAGVVVTVKVEVMVPLAAGVTEAGAKLQVTVAEAGAIPQVNATAALKLFTDVTVIVEVVVFPMVVVTDTGKAVTV